jgi:hypothetical protein
MTIPAPINGTAVTKPAAVGDVVSINAELVQLADFASILVEVDVPEGRLGAVKPKGPCEIVLDAFPDKRRRGEVVEVSPRLNRAKASGTVKVKFVDPASGALPEMAARVSFLAKPLDAAELSEPPKKIIPAAAVVDRSGAKIAFVLDNGKARMISVTLGPAFAGGVYWPAYVVLALIALVVIPAAIYLASWYPFFERGQFHTVADLVDYTKASYEYHAHLTATHPYGSPWWSWPFLARPVLYYAEYTGLGTDQFTGQPLVAWMSDLGNPWIWWTSLPCVLSLPYFIVRHKSFAATLILIGFITQYLPWAPITRVLFMYHMFGGLIFMILALAFVLAWIAESAPRTGRRVAIAHLALAVTFFLYFYPVWTALPISNSALYIQDGTPIWGPKIWLVHCESNLPPQQPDLWCWS